MLRERCKRHKLLVMERQLTVAFGPTRSKRLREAIAEADLGAGECSEPSTGRYEVRFALAEDASAYRSLARLLERVRHWRASEVREEGEPVSLLHAKEMAWCASFQLETFAACRNRFYWGIQPKCSLCPLFDAERALRDALGENPPPGLVFEIRVRSDVHRFEEERRRSILQASLPVPDFPPSDWAGGSFPSRAFDEGAEGDV
jgi:hypothetical protein